MLAGTRSWFVKKLENLSGFLTAVKDFNEGFQAGDGTAVHRGGTVAFKGQDRYRQLFFDDDVFNLAKAERLDIVNDAVQPPPPDFPVDVGNPSSDRVRVGIGQVLGSQVAAVGTRHAELSLDFIENDVIPPYSASLSL